MVLPLIPIALIGGASLIGAGGAFGYFRKPDETITENYSTTNQYQTKKSALTLGEGAKVGSVTFKDTLTQSATTEQSADQSQKSSLLSNPLILAGGAVVVAYILTNRGK
jgi:hypothetical protein